MIDSYSVWPCHDLNRSFTVFQRMGLDIMVRYSVPIGRFKERSRERKIRPLCQTQRRA